MRMGIHSTIEVETVKLVKKALLLLVKAHDNTRHSNRTTQEILEICKKLRDIVEFEEKYQVKE